MPPDSFGKRLAQARRELGVREHRDVSRGELAEAGGVVLSMISQYEADTKMPRDDVLARLATYLHVTPAWLRYGVAPVSPAYYGEEPQQPPASLPAMKRRRKG